MRFVRLATLVGVGLAVAALSACGSSHRTRLRDYSLQQVKHVFAAEGVPLRQTRFGPAKGVVKLVNHKVEVDVDVGGATNWLTASSGDLLFTGIGNVYVNYPPSQRRAIKAALRSLEA